MKTNIILLSTISSFVALSSFGQAIESDDMYFNKKDRAKLKEQKPVEEVYVPYTKKKEVDQSAEEVYARADYSARNVNPEYAARSNAQEAQTDNQDYFVANYQYENAPANNLNQFNNNLNNWNNSPMYSSNYMSSAMNSWNSPYYGMNNMYNSPWYDPFYSNNGFSSSFSYYHGNAYNYGWGGNYNYWNQPYCGGSQWGYGYASGWGSNNYGYGGYGYPSNVIIVNNYSESSNGRGVAYGKRPTMAGGVVSNNTNNVRSRNANGGSVVSNNGTSRTNSGGRTSQAVPAASPQQSAYYNRSWRVAQQIQSSTQPNSNSRTSNNNWNNTNQQNSSNDLNRSNQSNTRSSYDGGSNSGGTRTQSSQSSGSGTNARTRGRD